MTFMPGHIRATSVSSGFITSGANGGGGKPRAEDATSSTLPLGSYDWTLMLGSANTSIRTRRISSGESPGKILQFTLAVARWGNALLACPPANRVATQVVRIVE